MTPEIIEKSKRLGEEFSERILKGVEDERRATAIRVAERIRTISGGAVTIQQVREALSPEGFIYKGDSAYCHAARALNK